MSATLRWNMPLGAISDRLRRNVVAAMAKSGEDLKTAIVESIIDGAILGEGHIASKPGEPPNADTGELHQSYGTEGYWAAGGAMRMQRTGSPLEYARWLEDGNSVMEARPHVGPAEARLRAAHLDRMKRAMKAAVGG